MVNKKLTISTLIFLMIFSFTFVSATTISDTTSIFSGNVTAPYFIGDGSQLTGISGSGIWTNVSGVAFYNGNVNVSGNFTPSLNNTYSLGTPDLVWKDIHVGSGSIYLGNYILDAFNENFRIRNGTTDLMFFNKSENEMVFTTNIRLLEILRHASPVLIEEGISFVNASGVKFFDIEIESVEHNETGYPALDGSLLFGTHNIDNLYNMEVVFWDDDNKRPALIINKGGTERASVFDRSLLIGKNLGNAPVDEHYTHCMGFNLIDCMTNTTGADFGVEDDIEAKGSILAQENITATYFFGDGSQLTGVNIITESTGLINGGVVSVNSGDSTLIDISAGSGQVVDSTTDPNNQTLTPVSWNNITGYNLTTTADPGDVVAIYLALDSGGNVVERLALPTPEERRDTIDLGIAARYEDTFIVFAGSGPTNVIHSPSSQVQDLMEAWGAFNIDGNRILSYGAGLQIQKSAGSVFRNGANFQTNEKNPNVISLAEQAPVDPFNYKLGDGTDINGSASQLDPNYYDDGTSTLATVPNNKWTVQYVSVFALGLIEILYGQEIFDSEEDAIVAMSNIDFIIPTDSQNAIPLAYVILQQGDTSLTDDRFYRISRGGAAGGGGVTYTAGTGLILNGGSGTEFQLNTTYTDNRYVNIGGDNITGNLNMTSNNITTVDCITFKSGGRICDAP